MILFIAVAVATLIGLVFWVKHCFFVNDLLRSFKKKNVIVFGKKGTGKDLVFQYVIKRRKEPYYANLDYGGKFEKIQIKDISVWPNTYDSLINGEIQKVKLHFEEHRDIYISDGGIYLPSWSDSKLYKAYPSFPIYYAVNRHLTDSNIHINTQNLDRVWKAIREQADFYVKVRGTFHFFGLFITRVTTYDKYSSAQRELAPLGRRLGNSFSKAEADKYEAENGEIKEGWIIQWKPKYDTRYFRKLFVK